MSLTRILRDNPLSTRLILALCLAITSGLASGQSSQLPTRGTRFWSGFMRNTNSGAANLRIHILSTTATSGTVSVPLGAWSVPFTVAANSATIVEVPISYENIGSGTIAPKGVLITSVDSVNVFLSSFQNQTHDLTQVLPETSLGNAYRVDAYKGFPNLGNLYKSELVVVAAYDGTQIQIIPSANLLGGPLAGVPVNITLNAGQTYQLQAATDALDLTGTTVRSAANSTCKPFAVIGGSQCALVPSTCQACDMIFEQMLPLATWGMRYFTAPVNAVSNFTFRILADQNTTSVTINGGAPIILNAGQVYETNNTNVPACIQSDKPISVAQMLQGNQCAGPGDPSMILIPPADRLTRKASFQTLTSGTLNQHSISVVMPASALGQLTLDGATVSTALFQPYATCTDRVHAKIPVTPGVHRLAAAGGFQLYMFGLGNGESYGANVSDLAATPVQNDSLICNTGPVTLNSPEPLTNAQWTAATAPSVVLATGNTYAFTPTASNSYTVTGGSSITGCPRSFTYHIGVPPTIPTVATANGADANTICQYEEVQLGLNPPPDPAWFNITWSPASSLNNPNIPAPIGSPFTTTWYRVNIVSPVGCGNYTDSVLVTVLPAQVRDLTTRVNDPSICVGESVNLSSTALRVIAAERFNAPPGSMWSGIQGGAVGAQCGALTGTALYFNGAGQRYAQTNSFNTTGGGRVEFHLKVGTGVAPCDNADPGEDIILQYSTNNGITWNNMPGGLFNQDLFPVFTPVSVDLPVGAQGASVSFKISQVAHSGAGQDNWSIDDLFISRVNNTWLSYQWTPVNATPNSANTSASPTTSQWYVLRATDPTAGCIYKDSVFVQVSPAFNLTVTTNTVQCTPSPLQLNATPSSGTGIQYAWTTTNGVLNANNISNPVANANVTATYNVLATSSIGCVANGAVTVTIAPTLGLTLSAVNTTLCQGQSTQLSAAGTGANGLTYSWTGAGLSATNIANPIASPTQTTTYTCSITHTATGCTKSSTITITVNTGYSANAGVDRTVCTAIGEQLNVTHNLPNAIYAWSPPGSLSSSSIQSPTITAEGTQTFTVVITDANGCSVTDNIVITRAYNNIPASQNVAGCSNVTNTLTAPATGSNYSWTTPNGPGPSGPNAQSMTATVSGTHTVTITNAQGCQGTTTFNVVLHAVPIVDLGPDIVLCGANNHALNAGNAGANFSWNTNATTQSITVTTTGTYTVSVTNGNGCVVSDNVHVRFNAMPVDVLQNVTACATTPPTLNAGNAGATYSWNTNATTQTIVANSSGTYTVLITMPNQCSATYDAVVNIAPALSVDLGNDTTVCQGSNVPLNAGTPGSTYLWNGGATTQMINATATGNYSVTVSNAACSATDAINVTVAPMPVDLLQNVTTCITTPPTLNAGNTGSTFLWNTNAATQTLSATTSGTYTVLVTTPQQCSATFDAVVTLAPELFVALGNDTTICQGSALVLDSGTPSASHVWNTGATSQTLNVTSTGTYSVTITNAGCSATDAIAVNVANAPVDILNDIVACADQTVTLNAGNPGSTFLWSTSQTTQSIMPTTSGTYSVTVTTPNNCIGTFNSDVVISPVILIDLGNDTTLCQGAQIQLDVTTPSATYVWTTGSVLPLLDISQPGTYGVTVTNPGCSATDVITVNVIAAPIDVLQDVTTCIDQTITLDAGNIGSSYLWSTGPTTRTISPTSSGTYTVTVTNSNNCTSVFNSDVHFVDMPVIELGEDTVLCDGHIHTLDAKNSGSTYLWNTGATTRTLDVSTANLYIVTVNNGHCTARDSIDIRVNPSPSRIAVEEIQACLDDDPGYVVIDAGNQGSSFIWSSGETSQTIGAGIYGMYIVVITNIHDCSVRDSVLVTEYCPSSIFLPNTFTPNGDGLNDIFIPIGKNIAKMHMRVFDRWGEPIFESTDPNVGWDGTYNGSLVKNDIYAWKIEYQFIDENGDLGFLQKKIGHIQVLL